MARERSVYRCQECGLAAPKAGTCPDCARVGSYVQLVEERVRPCPGGIPSGRFARRPAAAPRRYSNRGWRARRDGDRRAGSCAGRRRGEGIPRPDRRRPGNWQVHAAPAGESGPRRQDGPGALRFGRGVGGTGQAPRGAARDCAPWPVLRGRERPRAGGTPCSRAAPARAHRGLDPDRVLAGARVGARQRQPGQGVRRPADDARQAVGHGDLPRGPRHEGGRAGGAAGARTSRRHRAVLRRRAAPCLPSAARRQEPVRVDQRDRRVRDGRDGARGGDEPVGFLPRGASHAAPRGRSSSRAWRGHARCCSSCRRS